MPPKKAVVESTIGYTIEHAYGELTHKAFAVWIRMMTFSEKDLRRGRVAIAKLLGHSRSNCDVILRELKNKGYLTIEGRYGSGYPTVFTLRRKAILVGKDHFIKLSRILSKLTKTDLVQDDTQTVFEILAQILGRSCVCKSEVDEVQIGSCMGNIKNWSKPLKKKALAIKVDVSCVDVQQPASSTTGCEDVPQMEKNLPSSVFSPHKKIPTDSSTRKMGKMPFAENAKGSDHETRSARLTRNLGSPIPKTKALAPVASRAVNLTRMGVAKDNKKPRFIGPSHPGVDAPGAKSWNGPAPTITFTLKEEQRLQMIEVLERKAPDKEKRVLLKKLGSCFSRIYKTIRRRTQPSYIGTHEKETQLCEQAGADCIRAGITPTQLIEFWIEHANDFTQMKFPSVAFLSRPAQIDRAVCEVIIPKMAPGRRAKPAGTPAPAYKPILSDVAYLDPRIRPALMRGGFDLSEWPDRYLLSVQSCARTLLDPVWGPIYHIPDEVMGGMARYVADHVFGPDADKVPSVDEVDPAEMPMTDDELGF